MIRPFVYVREKDLRTFADSCHLPVIAENCPACFEAPKVTLLQPLLQFFVPCQVRGSVIRMLSMSAHAHFPISS